MNNNIAHIKGRILYKYVTPKANNVILKIGTGKNIVDCFVSDPILKKHVTDFSVGNYINLEGNIQSSRRYDANLNQTKDTQIIFVDNITPIHYTDRSWYNRFWLYGKIVRVQELHGCLKLVIRTCNNGHLSFVPIVIYFPDNKIRSISQGSNIHVEGSVQSVKKYDMINGKHIYYQNYVASRVW